MTYPKFKDKHAERALFQPSDLLRYNGLDRVSFPDKYVFTYQTSALTHFIRKYAGRLKRLDTHSFFPVYVIKDLGIGFVRFNGIGAPNTTTFMEEFIALGGKEFINIGTAGGLKSEGVFVCDKALRDEGTSYHYLPHGDYTYPDEGLTERLKQQLTRMKQDFNIGTTWTIDAPYRETKAEVEQHRREGIVTVEMEASALFAVANYRKVKIASAFVVSDVLGKKWDPKFNHINVKQTQNKLIDVAIDTFLTETR